MERETERRRAMLRMAAVAGRTSHTAGDAGPVERRENGRMSSGQAFVVVLGCWLTLIGAGRAVLTLRLPQCGVLFAKRAKWCCLRPDSNRSLGVPVDCVLQCYWCCQRKQPQRKGQRELQPTALSALAISKSTYWPIGPGQGETPGPLCVLVGRTALFLRGGEQELERRLWRGGFCEGKENNRNQEKGMITEAAGDG